MRVGVGIAVLTVLVAATLPRGSSADPTPDEKILAAFEQKLKAVAESVGPSVACVVVSHSDAYPKSDGPPGRLGGFDPKEFVTADPSPARADLARRLDLSDPHSAADHGCAGGVVTDAEGLVLVNYHTIEDATKVYVHLGNGKGSYADVRAADRRSDLAVLKLLTPPPGLTPIRFAEVRTIDRTDGRKATVYRGKLVALLTHTAVGGFTPDRPSSPVGSITNVRARHPSAVPPDPTNNQGQYTVYEFGTFLEYDARRAFGGSGGALLNLDGELVGLTTAVVAPTGPETGPGFALPMDANTRRIVDVLRRGEEVEYGFLGVVLGQGVAGVRLDAVTPQGPAQLAGLRPYEEIVQVDDVPVADQRDVFYGIGNALAGTRVKVRTGPPTRRVVEVTLAKLPHSQPYVASVRPEPVFGLRVEWGSVLINANLFVRQTGVPPGVFVRELVPNSPAAVKFKELGDFGSRAVIIAVNGTPVATPADFYRAAKGRSSVKLTLVDPLDTGSPRELTLP